MIKTNQNANIIKVITLLFLFKFSYISLYSQPCSVSTGVDIALECGMRDTLKTKVVPLHDVKDVFNSPIGYFDYFNALDSSLIYFLDGMKLYTSEDLGKTWKIKLINNLNFAEFQRFISLWDIKYITKDIVYAVSLDYNSDSVYLFKSINGGNSWQHIFSFYSYDYNFNKMAFYNTKLKFLLLDEGYFIYDEISENFQFKQILKDISFQYVNYIRFESDNEVYAAIYEDGLYKSIDGGLTWIFIEKSSFFRFHQIFNDGTGYKIGMDFLFRTVDYGKTWQNLDLYIGSSSSTVYVNVESNNKLQFMYAEGNNFGKISTEDGFKSFKREVYYGVSHTNALFFSSELAVLLNSNGSPYLKYYDTRLTYQWKDPQGNVLGNESELKIQPLTGGNYTVKITAPTGCVATDAVNVIVNPLQLSVPASISLGCGGKAALSVSSNYMGSGSLAYIWSPTTGLDNPQSANPTASVSTDTDYKVDALSTEGCTASATVPVKVVPVLADAGIDVDMVCGDTLALTAKHNLGVAENIVYQWNNLSGEILSANKTHTVNPAAPASYVLSIDAGNNCKDTDTIQVGIKPLIANILAPTKLECGDSIRLDMSHNSNNHAGTYLWLPNAGLTDRTAKRPLCFFTATTNVQLEYTKPNGCKAVAEKTLPVYPVSVFVADKIVSCGQTAYFNPTLHYFGKYPLTYQWQPSEGVSNTGILNPAVNSTISKSYSLSVSSSNGCITEVKDIPLKVQQRNFGLSFSQNQQVFTKPPFEVLFLNTTTDKSLYDFTWYYGDGSTYAGTNPPKYEYKQNGLYDVALHAIEKTSGCANQLVKPEWILCDGGVVCGHKAEISFSCGNGNCKDTIYLMANTGEGFTYQWTENGFPILDATTSSLKVTRNAEYQVLVTKEGCVVQSDKFRASGISNGTENTEIEFNFYPNPVSDRLHLEKSDDAPCRIQLYSLTGKLLLEDVWIERMKEVDMQNYPAGIYLIKMYGGFGVRVEKVFRE